MEKILTEEGLSRFRELIDKSVFIWLYAYLFRIFAKENLSSAKQLIL